jgi:hypothetical protein
MQQVVRHRSKTKIAHRLQQLGCTKEQVQRHLARGKELPAVVELRPRPLEWRSWETRIRNTRP